MSHEIGKVCWFDIPVTNFEKAKGFYGELFGWKFEPMGEGYEMIKVGESTIGGLRQADGPREESDSPVIYLVVDELDKSTEKAKSLGAAIVGDKVVISEDGGAFQWFRDEDRNLLSLWAKG